MRPPPGVPSNISLIAFCCAALGLDSAGLWMPLALWGARFKEKLYMKHNNSSFANPLKVVLNRIGEPCLAHYGAARTPLDTPEKAHAFWGEIIAQDPGFEPDKEHLVAILLDTKLRPIGYHVVSVGTINETVAHPREIFRSAIVAAAYGLVLMHNHPSGDPQPSQADRRMTSTMREASNLLQINLIDHVIYGTAEDGRLPYFSFRDAGLL